MKSTTIFGRSSLKCSPCLTVKAHIERGFSVNKEIVAENLLSKCLCAQCLVYDAINFSGKGVHEIDLPNKLVTSCITSCSCYNVASKEIQKKQRFCKQKLLILSERKWN